MEGGQEQCLDSFGDTGSHLPDCCSFTVYALVSDAEGPYLNRLSQRKPLSVSDICPAKLVNWQPVIPNGSTAIPCMAPCTPGQIATPQRCVPERSLGAQIGLGRGRQNERGLAMKEDPPIDLEEVVVGT
jgi:hypothetical protein